MSDFELSEFGFPLVQPLVSLLVHPPASLAALIADRKLAFRLSKRRALFEFFTSLEMLARRS
jgi:hypothetical protein